MMVVLFIFTVEGIQLFFLDGKDNYSSLTALSRFQLPIIGAIIILFFAWLTGYKYIRTGIPFVLHRLKIANGVIPLRNTINQFIGSSVALIAGFSVGREGPAVHLGAACSSYIGNKLNLPYNAIRSLSACGIAAGIAACFNTPIAAVLFVMEVILREYKVHIFIPVMIAAIVGSMTTSLIFGPNHEFGHFSEISLNSDHYPALVLLGVALGIIAFAFNRTLILVIKYSASFHIVPRILLAAFITGLIGYMIGLSEPVVDPRKLCFFTALRTKRTGFPFQGFPASNFSPDIAPEGKQVLHTDIVCEHAEASDKFERQRLLKLMWQDVEEMFPGIDDKVEWKIPYYVDGCDGLARKPGLVGNFKPGLQAPGVSDLYFAGDTYIGRGLAANGAARSAMQCADIILKELSRTNS